MPRDFVTPITRSCEMCQRVFTFAPGKRGPIRRWCSLDCRLHLRKRTRRKATTICEACGASFHASYVKPPQRYCSPACNNSTRRRYPTKAAQRAAQASRRRAKRKAVTVIEIFDRLAVFERDGWICGICGGAVDPALRHPDHMAASLDHIRPIAAGGDHTMANSQCSHWICNSLKGDHWEPDPFEAVACNS